MAASKNLQEEISQLEKELMDKKKKLVDLRKQMPTENVQDYQFLGQNGNTIKLSEMFGENDELMLIHNMGKGCPYCTLWADGFNGMQHHLSNRTTFVVVSPDEPAVQQEFAASRDWKFKMYSSKGSTFQEDLNFLIDGSQYPGVSTFKKEANGNITRVAYAYFGPGDNYCSTWDLFDLLPEGAANWEPKFKY